MRARHLVAVTAATAVLMGGIGVPARAVEAPPPVPTAPVTLPPELDMASFYEPQTVCDPVSRPGALALRDLLVATYGPATVYIPRACTSSTSEHFDGRAVDWMRSVRVAAEKAQAEAFVAWLLAPAADGTPQEMARRLGIMYLIWNNRMIRTYDVARGWTDYRSCMDPANAAASLDTTCHRNHVHLSMSWDGAAKATSWWTGAALTTPYCRATSTVATPGAGTATLVAEGATVPGMVPVTPTTILSTRTASGAGLASPCRLLAGRALRPVARVSAIPAEATRVVVRVSSRSNAPSRLAAWSSGATKPLGQLSTRMGLTSGTLVVPMASDGTISLSTSVGAAHLTVSVIGYLTAAAPPPPSTPPPPPPPVVTPTPPPATVATVPGRPRSIAVRSAKRVVRTSWLAPRSSGGARILGYRVQALTSARKGARVAGSCRVGPTARSCTIKGLRVGRTYWMSVSVTNRVGTTWALRKPVRVRR